MNEIVLKVRNLGKKFEIGKLRKRNVREQAEHLVALPFRKIHSLFTGGQRRPPAIHDSGESVNRERSFIWALREVSFEVKQGEVVGIIGRNGAGKSTLLKILSRITSPTEGEVEIQGRVASLLEVGTGFHPELTGRENIYMGGALLGMSRDEITKRFDEIVSFSEVEQFIDTPVKHYSSGMYVRLAFAVAAHLEPEILIIDEVLSVGDVSFQRKCLGKMNQVASQDRTVLFVSHNLAAVNRLCNRAVLLHRGRLLEDGSVDHVLEKYVMETLSIAYTPLVDRTDREGNGPIRVVSIHFEDAQGNILQALRTGMDCRVVLDYVNAGGTPTDNVVAAVVFKDHLGIRAFFHQSDFIGKSFRVQSTTGHFVCKIPRLPVVAGEYTLSLFVGQGEKALDLVEEAGHVLVEFGDYYGTGHAAQPQLCRTLFNADWEVNQ